jgi:hypothetical protein
MFQTKFVEKIKTNFFVQQMFFENFAVYEICGKNLNQKVTTIITGHGNICSYLHRLKIIGSAECHCKHGIQTVDYLIFQCNSLNKERETLKKSVSKAGEWPVRKSELINKHLQKFINYLNSMDLENIRVNQHNKQSQM